MLQFDKDISKCEKIRSSNIFTLLHHIIAGSNATQSSFSKIFLQWMLRLTYISLVLALPLLLQHSYCIVASRQCHSSSQTLVQRIRWHWWVDTSPSSARCWACPLILLPLFNIHVAAKISSLIAEAWLHANSGCHESHLDIFNFYTILNITYCQSLGTHLQWLLRLRDILEYTGGQLQRIIYCQNLAQ